MAKFKFLPFVILAGLVLPVSAQTITLSQTGNPELDGTYTATKIADSQPAFTKTKAGTTYQISQFKLKNNLAAGWMITDSKGQEYFAVNTGLNPLPAPPADGWDVGRAGVNLNVNFSVVYAIPSGGQQNKNQEAYSLSFTNTVKTSVALFPNPSTGIINIIGAENTNLKYTIQDLTGKVLLTGSSRKVDITSLPAGIYILNIEVGKEKIQKKIIKA